MQSNRPKNTAPELLLRRLLRKAGWPGYRIHWGVPGRPDIAYPGLKLAVFVHGCFWHRCAECSPHMPQSNSAYWEAKFARTIERDAENCQALERLGWTVATVWECRLAADPDAVLKDLVSLLEQLRAKRHLPQRGTGRHPTPNE